MRDEALRDGDHRRVRRLASLIPPPSSLGRRSPAVMAILNVTPDSFSDGGVHFERATAVESALRMEREGAAIVDVGGESTRPGAEPVSLDEELARVVPVIEEIRRRSDVAISIDTRHAEVAGAALDAGADVLNDVTAMRDARMRAVAAERGVPVVLMHMRGEPRTMQEHIHYDDVVTDVLRELRESYDAVVAAGVDPEQIVIDPGIGFAKTFDHNLEILGRCHELASLRPFLIGASRKAFIGHLTGRPNGPSRMPGSLAAVAAAYRGGAAMVRVHDVGETVDFLRVMVAIEERR